MGKPILVIGKNRSGTKWLSNILSRHSQVASVQREGAGGVLETNVFVQFPAVFGDLKQEENFCAMAACFAKSNFFRCTGLDEKMLFERHFDSYCDFFRHVMDRYADTCQVQWWLQKSDPLAMPSIYHAFPDGKFLMIERNVVDNIRSTVGLQELERGQQGSVLNHLALYHLSRKMGARYLNWPNVMPVTYEALREDRESVTRQICQFVGLPFEPHILDDVYERNTSFQKGVRRDEILTPLQTALIKAATPLFRITPLVVLQLLRKRFGVAQNSSINRFVAKSFSILRKEFGWSDGD